MKKNIFKCMASLLVVLSLFSSASIVHAGSHVQKVLKSYERVWQMSPADHQVSSYDRFHEYENIYFRKGFRYRETHKDITTFKDHLLCIVSVYLYTREYITY
ncbi:hypothetical protein C3495_14640 (plasmid) [Clostridiaceae bacterium 14S0207]|nr:hypothetical protein C3495_14640 [Clostridiaceae bacterium 14S0207]